MQMAQNSLMSKYVVLNSDFVRGIALFVGATEKPIHTRRQQGVRDGEDDRVGKKIIAFLFLSKARPKGILFFRSPFSIWGQIFQSPFN